MVGGQRNVNNKKDERRLKHVPFLHSEAVCVHFPLRKVTNEGV